MTCPDCESLPEPCVLCVEEEAFEAERWELRAREEAVLAEWEAEG